MKSLIALLAIATTSCLAAEVAYSPAGSKAQGALLVLPLKQANNSNNNNTTSTTPKTVANGTENLDDVNAKLSEKQGQGSQQGVFHVYLQDGRLQKVQYITTPITSGQQAQQQQTPQSSNNQQQTPEIIIPEFADRRRVFFVEVPQERIQALQANAQQDQNIQTSTPAQYNQEESTPINVRYLPLEDTSSSPSQYRQELASEVPVVRYLPVPLSEDYRRSEEASGQQVVLQYSEVQPIRGPVYSYSPQAITRILRFAPEY